MSRNCRCCHATYEKPTDYWCQSPTTEPLKGWRKWFKRFIKPKIVEPVGFCEFCDKNNKTWYIPNKKCHFNQ